MMYHPITCGCKKISTSVDIWHKQSYLRASYRGGQHDPHLRIIGGRCETLNGHIIHMLQNK